MRKEILSREIFLNYASEDCSQVDALYERLLADGFQPWMDVKKLIPGEVWKVAIERALRNSSFFLACLSSTSVKKRGYVQVELKRAQEIWQEKLLDDIYLIPVRLDSCAVPIELQRFQWVNLYEVDGYQKLTHAIQIGLNRIYK